MVITLWPKDNGILDYNFFGCGGPLSANLVSLATLKYGDCWEGNIFLSMEMLNERFNLGINAVVYFMTHSTITFLTQGGRTTMKKKVDGSAAAILGLKINLLG